MAAVAGCEVKVEAAAGFAAAMPNKPPADEVVLAAVPNKFAPAGAPAGVVDDIANEGLAGVAVAAGVVDWVAGVGVLFPKSELAFANMPPAAGAGVGVAL